MRVLDRFTERLEDVFLVAASAFVGVTAVLISGGAIARYLFQAPVGAVNELVTIYLGPGITFLAISAALRDGSHIAIDVVARRLPKSFMRWVRIVVYLLSLLVFAVITWKMSERAVKAWETDDVVFGSFTWPLFVAYALVAVGTGVLVLRHALIITKTVIDPEAVSVADIGTESDAATQLKSALEEPRA